MPPPPSLPLATVLSLLTDSICHKKDNTLCSFFVRALMNYVLDSSCFLERDQKFDQISQLCLEIFIFEATLENMNLTDNSRFFFVNNFHQLFFYHINL